MEDVNMIKANKIMETLRTSPSQVGRVNLFKALLGEVFPTGVYCNHQNFLIQEFNQVLKEELLTNIVQQEIKYRFQHTVIASFVGPKIPIHCIVDWVGLMNAMVKIGVINF
jgi:hypothetical protein